MKFRTRWAIFSFGMRLGWKAFKNATAIWLMAFFVLLGWTGAARRLVRQPPKSAK